MWRFLSVLWLMVSASLWAHGGEDHSHDAATVAAPPAGHRLTATSGAVEAVLVAEPGADSLMLYLAELGSNLPVLNAEVDVLGLTLAGPVRMTSAGQYQLKLDAPLRSEAQQLALTVSAKIAADVVLELLDIHLPAEAAAGHVAEHSHWPSPAVLQPLSWLWLALAFGLTWVTGMLAGAWLTRRARRQPAAYQQAGG